MFPFAQASPLGLILSSICYGVLTTSSQSDNPDVYFPFCHLIVLHQEVKPNTQKRSLLSQKEVLNR